MQNNDWCEGLSFESWEEKHESEDILMGYLHGCCDEWVLENYQDGDKPIIWNHFDYDMEDICLVHCFIKRGDMYLDVRGATMNIENIKEGFEDLCSDDNSFYECKNLEEYKAMIRKICEYTDEKWK